MTEKEQIRAEIARYIREEVCSGYSSIACCRDLLKFIDSLPEEKPSDELEEAAENCVWNSIDSNDSTLVPKFIPLLLSLFISGAYWQKEQMMKDSEEDALLLERARLTLYYLGDEEVAERLRQFAERKGLTWK